jgi:hypothetical protein
MTGRTRGLAVERQIIDLLEDLDGLKGGALNCRTPALRRKRAKCSGLFHRATPTKVVGASVDRRRMLPIAPSREFLIDMVRCATRSRSPRRLPSLPSSGR